MASNSLSAWEQYYSTWQWLAFGWLGLGICTVVITEIGLRQPGEKGLLSQEGPLWFFVYSIALLIAAPFLLLCLLGLSVKLLWQRKIQIIRRAWWPARVAQFAPQASRETTLCQMIELRRWKDPRVRRRGSPSNWPMFELWDTTEATILDIVEQFFWLRDTGLDEQIALEKIEIIHRGTTNIEWESWVTLPSYICRRLAEIDPLYLKHETKILDCAISIAEKWAKEELKRQKSQPPFPPKEWLEQRINSQMVENEETYSVNRRGRDWKRIKILMLSDDELWTFSSPPEYWLGLAGRAGVALVREGRVIAHAITAMN